MERIYIEKDMAEFTRKDMTLVDMKLSDGRCFENLEPRRLFPVSDARRYITLLDESGTEQAVIRDLDTLPPTQRKIIAACLEEYYLIPIIERILACDERVDGITLHAETDRGPADIEIRVLLQGFKPLSANRVIVRDVNDNRYEIPDITRMDKHSRQILGKYF